MDWEYPGVADRATFVSLIKVILPSHTSISCSTIEKNEVSLKICTTTVILTQLNNIAQELKAASGGKLVTAAVSAGIEKIDAGYDVPAFEP